MSARNLLASAAYAGSQDELYVDDVFKATLYTGNGSSQTITTGIALTNGITLPLGSFFGGGYYLGDITDGGVQYALICAPRPEGHSSTLTAWGPDAATTGTTSRTNGPTNTTTLDALTASYPAAELCAGLTINSHTDWYLPAVDELAEMYKNRSSLPAGQDFDFNTYWSSTESSDTQRAYTINFSGGAKGTPVKSGTTRVRAVRRIPLTDPSLAQYYVESDGGLVWIKNRSSTGDHNLFDTHRGADRQLFTNSTLAQYSTAETLTGFNANGFDLGIHSWVNNNAASFVSWTFKKAKKFFDIVTYTGNGVAGRQIPHNLGVEPGMIVVKRLDAAAGWIVWHRGSNPGTYLVLNTTEAQTTSGSHLMFGNGVTTVDPTSDYFTVGTTSGVNTNGGQYVAYLFAHDSSEDGIIQCGSYTGNGSASGPEINLGWEPQFLLIKNASAAAEWTMFDTARGLTVGNNDRYLMPQANQAEVGPSDWLDPTSTGFRITNSSTWWNGNGQTYIYMAIRRPNKPPTSGTEVFSANALDTTNPTTITTGFDPDLVISKDGRSGPGNIFFIDRLRGAGSADNQKTLLMSTATNAETATSGRTDLSTVSGGYRYQSVVTAFIGWAFRRAPGFFDQVCYTTDNLNHVDRAHQLGVSPELIITKNRANAEDWWVWCSHLSGTKTLNLNTSNALSGLSCVISASAEQFKPVTRNASTHVAYLFATLPGISKVGSYTGNGSSQIIDCGFTTGARFVLIKRTDSTGNWYVWDTARGIIAANDPHLSLNTMAAEVTTNDSIDPDTAGFVVNQNTATNINVSSGTYIYLAIA